MHRHVGAIMAAALIAGCGDQGGVRHWPEREACRAFDKRTLRRAAKQPTVTAGEASLVETGDVVMASCTWRFTDQPGHIALLLRTSRAGDYSDGAVAAARSAGGIGPPPVEVPALGRVALWNATMHSLMVFVDDHRLLTVGFVRPPAGLATKAAAIRLARRLIG